MGKSKTIKKRKEETSVFQKKHFESNDGMVTTVWGPGAWHFLHTISFNYPVHPTAKEKKEYRDFVLSMVHVLPCGKCRENLKKNFKKLPLTMKKMKNRATFSRYIYDLHELINKMLNKKSGLSYEQVKYRYEHFRARCTQPLEKKNKTKKKKIEDGCVEPLVGEKSKCVLKIIPHKEKCDTFQIDKKCEKKLM
tara:strand:+ start:1789 stop:2367 length:579 start_codon:yes stop_codon:yes gene_type:complete